MAKSSIKLEKLCELTISFSLLKREIRLCFLFNFKNDHTQLLFDVIMHEQRDVTFGDFCALERIKQKHYFQLCVFCAAS